MWIVALLVILIVAGFVLFLARSYPFGFSASPAATQSPSRYDMNVNLPKVNPPAVANPGAPVSVAR